MKELVRTNNLVLISWLRALLADSNIECVVLDGHTSVLEGSAGAIPRRLMVGDDDYPLAQNLLDQSRDHFSREFGADERIS